MRTTAAREPSSGHALKITLFKASIYSVQLYLACFVLLVATGWNHLHGWERIQALVLNPGGVALAIAAFNYLSPPADLNEAKHVAMKGSLALGPLLIPIPLTAYAVAMTHVSGDYRDVAWVPMVVMLGLGQEAALYWRMRS